MIQLMPGKWCTILLVWPKIGIDSGSLETKQFVHIETTASFLAGTRLPDFQGEVTSCSSQKWMKRGPCLAKTQDTHRRARWSPAPPAEVVQFHCGWPTLNNIRTGCVSVFKFPPAFDQKQTLTNSHPHVTTYNVQEFPPKGMVQYHPINPWVAWVWWLEILGSRYRGDTIRPSTRDSGKIYFENDIQRYTMYRIYI